ncbi:MAG: protein NrnU [Betaproteobacteria bacterium]|nr:MAG: protein NrnU [Betaproteobacteria bacterium]
MPLLALGLVLFLGAHSLRIVADGWRSQQIARFGERRYKGLYSLASLLGFGLLIWGFVLARSQPVVLWAPPAWTHPLAAVLMLLAFVLIVAAYVPRNALKARLGHPMLLSVKTWAAAHLIANGTLADVLLFGSFLVWAVLCFRSARSRDRAAGTVYPAGTASGTALTVAIGAVAYALFAYWLHGWLFGVRPLP